MMQRPEYLQVVQIEIEPSIRLEGDLAIPDKAPGILLFAHGSGSGRHSPRNQFVARVLQQAGLATLLLDLLTRQEEAIDSQTTHLRFDIHLLATRLVKTMDWLARQDATRALKLGLFGASTGAGAALVATALRPDAVSAVVSRGGRPDLAGATLKEVRAPTLLIVGGHDLPMIDLNRQALRQLTAEKRLEIVPAPRTCLKSLARWNRLQNWRGTGSRATCTALPPQPTSNHSITTLQVCSREGHPIRRGINCIAFRREGV